MLRIRDVAKGEGRRGCAPPPGFSGVLAGRRPARAKTPAEATETLTEVTYICAETDKKKNTSGQSLTSDHLGPPEKQRPQ